MKDQGCIQKHKVLPQCHLDTSVSHSIDILDVTFLVFDIYKCSDKNEKTSRASRPAGRTEGGVETVSLKSEHFIPVSYHSKMDAISSDKIFKAHFRCSNLC